MQFLTKKQVEKTYKAGYHNEGDSWTDKRCKWNDYVEYLRSNGEISEKQAYSWGQPSFVNPPKPRLPKKTPMTLVISANGYDYYRGGDDQKTFFNLVPVGSPPPNGGYFNPFWICNVKNVPNLFTT